MKTKDLTYIGVFAALISICAWINIPSVVPFTMQTFGVFLALNVLGGKKGLLAILVYVFLGMVGIPVFAGFSGGVSILFGSTGGYILGFIFQGLIYILVARKESFIVQIFAQVLGLIACYTFGTLWFVEVYLKTNGAVNVITALSWCVIPYIIPDLIKMALAFFVGKRIKKAVKL